jgi:hypothetical protein
MTPKPIQKDNSKSPNLKVKAKSLGSFLNKDTAAKILGVVRNNNKFMYEV